MEENFKLALVSYSARNKVLKIPVSTSSQSDLRTLEELFCKEFDVSGAQVTFQIFDQDWGEFIEIDDDYLLPNKVKLRAIVSSLKMQDSVLENEGGGNDDDANTSCEDEEIVSGDEPTLSIVEDETGGPDVSVRDEDTVISSAAPKKKMKFMKTESDKVPLEDPYPLPKHYRADVEAALASKKMTKETMSSFLSAIASSMLVHKRYPTKEDYVNVSRSVIAKYPFMSSPAGTPYGAIVTSLINRFKEFRRTPVVRSRPDSSSHKSPKKKSPGITQIPAKPVKIPGEDSVSYKRHLRVLQAEYKKTRKNMSVVDELMTRTFPFRREYLLTGVHTLDSIFEQFPFLQVADQLMKELERILGTEGLKEEVRGKWKSVAPKILSQAELERRNKYVESALQKAIDFEDNCELAALLVLPALLPDSRYKVDTDKVLFMAKGCSDLPKLVQEIDTLEPYILVVDENEGYLIVDKTIIDQVELADASFLLMAAYFVYNIKYPVGCTNFYAFLEVFILKFYPEKASPSVKHFLAKIKA